jgi:hypothetical protein
MQRSFSRMSLRSSGLQHLRAQPNFSNRINAILPVQPLSQKYFHSLATQITGISSAVPPFSQGRFAIVTDVRRDAVDAECADDEQHMKRTAKLCGPDASTLASSLRKATFAGDGDKKARSPGRARNKL